MVECCGWMLCNLFATNCGHSRLFQQFTMENRSRKRTLRCDQRFSALCSGPSSVRRFNTLQSNGNRSTFKKIVVVIKANSKQEHTNFRSNTNSIHTSFHRSFLHTLVGFFFCFCRRNLPQKSDMNSFLLL